MPEFVPKSGVKIQVNENEPVPQDDESKLVKALVSRATDGQTRTSGLSSILSRPHRHSLDSDWLLSTLKRMTIATTTSTSSLLLPTCELATMESPLPIGTRPS